jgi:hypothetical protein
MALAGHLAQLERHAPIDVDEARAGARGGAQDLDVLARRAREPPERFGPVHGDDRRLLGVADQRAQALFAGVADVIEAQLDEVRELGLARDLAR